MEDFYKENRSKYANGELSEAAERKMERIEQKMMDKEKKRLEEEQIID